METGIPGDAGTATEHPSPHDLRAYLDGALVPAESARVASHLKGGCVRCLHAGLLAAARLRAELGPKSRRGSGGGLDGRERGFDLDLLLRHAAVFERLEVLLEGERVVAPELLRELLLLPPEERRTVLRTGRRYRFLALAERLTAECRSECFRDVVRAAELGRLAVDAAEGLPREHYPPGATADAEALAWAALGNAHRVRGDLVDAERALQVAADRLRSGSQDRRVRAEVLSLLGSLRTDQARFDEADEVLGTAARFYRDLMDDRNAAKALLKRANARGESGDARGAAALASECSKVVVSVADQELRAVTSQIVAYWLRESGDIAQARTVIERVRPRFFESVTQATMRLRFMWLDARIAWSEGETEPAERDLRAVRDEFHELNLHYDACLVGLDLALLYLEQGRTAEVRALARELIASFGSRQIHHHAMAALSLFHQAAAADELSVGFVRRLARYLRHARHNTFLAFQPAAT